MSNVKVSKIEGLNTSLNGISLSTEPNKNNVTIPNISFNIVNRGSPLVTDPLVLLNSFDQIHYYNTTGASLNLRTSLVQNAVYEFVYTASGGAANVDFNLQPNGTSYTSEFSHQYYLTNSSNAFQLVNQTFNTISFDHYGGALGTSPMGRLRFCTGPTNKHYQYQGSDTESLAVGYGRWTNNTRTWDWVGILGGANFGGDNKRCWIRRIS
jgi:hypothetical protein